MKDYETMLFFVVEYEEGAIKRYEIVFSSRGVEYEE